MLKLLSVEDDAVGDAFAVVLNVAIEICAATVFHDDLKHAAVTGFNRKRFIVFPDVSDEFTIVVDPAAVVESENLDRKFERLRFQVCCVTHKTVVAVDLFHCQRTGGFGRMQRECIQISGERSKLGQCNFTVCCFRRIRRNRCIDGELRIVFRE